MNHRAGKVNTMVLGVGLALVLPLVFLLSRGFLFNPREVPDQMTGTVAPTFALESLEGEVWELARLKGKPVVLNFWSTWCQPCRLEHDLLQQAAVRYPDVQFLGVIYSDEPDTCRRYLSQVGTRYEHLIDPNGRLAIEYGVAGVPETFFIDVDGTIRHKQVGPVNGPILSAQLDALVGG